MNDSPTTETETLTPKQARNLEDLLLDRLSNREQLEELTGVLGWKSLNNYRKSSEANREAEDRAVRRQFDQSGSDSKDVDLEGDNVGTENIVLGGIHNPPAINNVYPPQSSILPAILGAAVAIGVPLAGVGGYLMSQKPEVVQPGEDQSVKIGLGRIEDVVEE